MKGEDTGYSPWARERDERKRGRKLLDKGGGSWKLPPWPRKTTERDYADKQQYLALTFPPFLSSHGVPLPFSPPLINTSRVPVSGEQSGGNMRDETRACIRVFVCKMMSPTSISRCVVLGRWGVDFKSTCLRKVRNCVLVAFVPSKAGRPRISSQDLRWPHPLEIQKGGFNQCWVDTVWYNCYGTFCIIY